MLNIYDSEIWKGLDKKTIDSILSNSPIEHYKSGEIVIMDGEENNGKGYIIESGEVIVKKGDKQLATLKEGEIFGEIGLLTEDPRNATIVAKTDVKLIILSQESLFEIINNGNNNINKDIMKRIEENLKYVS